ncbi:MAG: COX15/CtaA family protein [Candidatus Nanopelagicales bacterium]
MPEVNAHHIHPAVLTVFRIAALLTFGAVVMGAMVCATESGAACPNWPGCYPGQVVPVAEVAPWIEFTHRLVAMSTTPFVLAAAVLATRMRLGTGVVRLTWAALVGALAAGFFGMMIILFELPWYLGMLDLTGALGSMIAMGIATLLIQRGERRWRPTALGRLAWSGVAALVSMHVLAIAVAGAGSYTRCLGWPLPQFVAADRWPALQAVRVVLAVLALGLLAISVIRAWVRPRLRWHGVLLGGVLAAEFLLGAALWTAQDLLWLRAAYSIVAVSVIWAWALLAARANLVTWSLREAPDVSGLTASGSRSSRNSGATGR